MPGKKSEKRASVRGSRIDAIVAWSAVIFPFLGAGLVVSGQAGFILGLIFQVQTPNDQLEAYIKAIIVLVALIAVAIFTQRFAQLEKIRIAIADIEDELRAKLYPEGSISPFLTSSLNFSSFIRETKKEITLIGLNLTTFLGSAYREQIDAQLLSGCVITVAIMEPSEVNLSAASNRSEVAAGRTDYYRKNIELSIDSLREFGERARKSGARGRIKLILLPFAPTFSLKAFDPGNSGGRIVVETYPHRTPDAPPIFILRPEPDRHWFEYFRHQMAIMLASGYEYPLG